MKKYWAWVNGEDKYLIVCSESLHGAALAVLRNRFKDLKDSLEKGVEIMVAKYRKGQKDPFPCAAHGITFSTKSKITFQGTKVND